MMQLAHKRKPASLIGNIIVLIIAAAIIYFFIIYISNYQINKVAAVNDKYLVTATSLIPDDYTNYVAELKALGFDKYTKPIIDYVYFYEDAKKIDRLMEYAKIENQCITRTTIAKINTQIQNRDELLDELNSAYSKKLNKLHWNTYIDILENKYLIDDLKTSAEDMPIC